MQLVEGGDGHVHHLVVRDSCPHRRPSFSFSRYPDHSEGAAVDEDLLADAAVLAEEVLRRVVAEYGDVCGTFFVTMVEVASFLEAEVIHGRVRGGHSFERDVLGLLLAVLHHHRAGVEVEVLVAQRGDHVDDMRQEP